MTRHQWPGASRPISAVPPVWRVALVGLGKMGRRHRDALIAHPRFSLAALIDPKPELAEQTPQIPYFASVGALPTGSVDCAIVATPTSTHAAVGGALLDRHIHLLIEKPLAPTERESRQLARHAEREHCTLVVGHSERFNPMFRQFRMLVDSGRTGALDRVDVVRAGPHARGVSVENHVLIDLAVHDLDLLQNALGPLELVHAEARARRVPFAYEWGRLSLRTRGGCSIDVVSDWGSPDRRRTITAHSTAGTWTFDLLGNHGEFSPNALPIGTVTPPVAIDPFPRQHPDEDALAAQLTEFARQLDGERSACCSPSEAADVIALVEGALRLARRSEPSIEFPPRLEGVSDQRTG